MKFAVIDKATATTHEIVAAVAGKRIRVLAYLMVAAGAVTATWKSAATALTGAMSLITGTPNQGNPLPNSLQGSRGVFETERGEALNLTLGGAVQVSGWLVYEETQ